MRETQSLESLETVETGRKGRKYNGRNSERKKGTAGKGMREKIKPKAPPARAANSGSCSA